MKFCFLEPDIKTHAIDGVVRNLTQWSTVTVVRDWQSADVVAVPIIGRRNHALALTGQLTAAGKKVVLHQYVLRSSMSPKLADWLPVWEQCEFIFTYLPLREWAMEEDLILPCFIHESPLGVDDAFMHNDSMHEQRVDILTSGRGWLTESVRECVLAAEANGLRAEHLGTGLNASRKVVQHSGLSTFEVRHLMQECRAVSGLRRIEGFELPAAEGACVGARPILFNKSHYSNWFGDVGVYITEQSREGVLAELTERLPTVERLTVEEREWARRRFDWFDIAQRYWQVLSRL